MELRQLEIFLAVADELHFGRAAERVHLSQPALTQAVARFEVQLGARLFERTSRRVSLTPAGDALVDRARALLADAEDAADVVGRTASGELGTVRVGIVGTAMLGILPALVRAVRTQHPDLRLTVVELTGAAQVNDLRAGRLDLGILHVLPDEVPAGIDVQHLDVESLAIALPADHRLAHRTVMRLVELRDDPLIMLRAEAEADTSSLYVDACVRAGFVPQVTQQVTSLQSILSFVAAGLGWAFVATSVVESLQRRGVTYVRLEGASLRLPTTLAWRAGALSPAAALVSSRALESAAGPDT